MKNLATLLITCGLMFALAASSAFAQRVRYSGFGKGLAFSAEDSTVDIRMSARIQNLFIVESPLPLTSPTFAASVRRARLKFDGALAKPRISFKIELGLSNQDMSSSDDAAIVASSPKLIYDAVVKYHIASKTTLWFGQTKLPGNRERVISSQKLQFVDRSIVNARFNIDRDLGFQLHHEASIGKMVIRPIASLSMGEGRGVTVGNIGGLDYTVRVEVLPFGLFEKGGDYFSSDLVREQKPKLSVGATFDYNDGAIRQGGQLGKLLTDTLGNYMQSDLRTGIADLMFKYRGFSLLAEAAYRRSGRKGALDAAGRAFANGYGVSVQAGYLFPNNIEIAGRYSRVTPLLGYATSLKNQEQWTLGLSKYYFGHDLKIQADLTFDRTLNTTFAGDIMRFRLQSELSF